MNIFALSTSPQESARQMIDKHVIKMPTETCQMLHTNILYMQYVQEHGKEPQLKDLKAFHQEIGSELMKPAMLNHPSTIWARQSLANFDWLLYHGVSLCGEYTHRYEKEHGTQKRIVDCGLYRKLIDNHNYPLDKLTPVTIAMDDSYRIENTFDDEWEFVIESYRHYYLEGKWEFAEWKKDRRPDWFPANWFAVKHNRYARAYNAAKPRRYPLPLMEE
jgi:hypothetical protein|tara:strand:- start:2 stop:655 length:654 start_codon:yes stop_codon:yes gene_type:complete